MAEARHARGEGDVDRLGGFFARQLFGGEVRGLFLQRGLNFAFAGRKDRKGDFRKLWIARINAAARLNGISYSKLMAGLKAAGSVVDRKMLADIAVRDANAFAALVASAKNAIDKQQLRASLDKATAK